MRGHAAPGLRRRLGARGTPPCRPSGLARRPSGLACRPSGLARRPRGLPCRPSGSRSALLLEWTQGFASLAGWACSEPTAESLPSPQRRYMRWACSQSMAGSLPSPQRRSIQGSSLESGGAPAEAPAVSLSLSLSHMCAVAHVRHGVARRAGRAPRWSGAPSSLAARGRRGERAARSTAARGGYDARSYMYELMQEWVCMS